MVVVPVATESAVRSSVTQIMVATLTFMAFGVITVFVLQLINGVSS